ncbi:MAG: serine--tRNA ligase [Bacteroidales bacterium]|jgi:seryl-tRNA synthetase|nr:serine--tRNA ligase [Bacteroidales bacterium]
MIPISTIRTETERVKKGLKKKNFPNLELIDEIIQLDNQKRQQQTNRDELQKQLNDLSRQIGTLIKEKKNIEAEKLKNDTFFLKQEIQEKESILKDLENRINEILILLPNVPHESVPDGYSSQDNIIVKGGGELPKLDCKAKPHWELAEDYDLIDFALGAKITGTGFPVYKSWGAKLERALIQFFLDKAWDHGYVEIWPPILVNEASAFATGQLPDKDGQMYYINLDELYIIPTAEVPITNIYRDTIIAEDDLPIKNVAYTPCFRREAGSYGKDVRGLNRLHQFDKIEIVQIAHPDKSYQILEEMVCYVESLVQALELPYRIVKLCGGDLSFTSALTYDFEVFSAAQKRWLEVSSVSNFENFQANRMKLRIKTNMGKTILAHTLNGSALALPRILAALLENNQTPNGIKIPKILVKYMGIEMINKFGSI